MRVVDFAKTVRLGRPSESKSTAGQILYGPPGWLLPAGFAALMISTAALYWAATNFMLFNGADTEVYRRGAENLWHGQSLYESEPDMLPFTYPPVAAVFFTPMRLLSPYDAGKALGAISLLCLFLIIWVGLGMLGVAKGRGRAGLAACLTAAAVWLEPTMNTVGFGQINLVLLLLVIADVATPNRRWHKGLGVGLATGIKLVPGLFVVYFVVTRRWRAAVVATGTFAASIAVGFVVDPHDSIEYWSGPGTLVNRIQETTQEWYPTNQSIRGLLLRTLGSTQAADQLWLVTAVAVAAGALWLAARASVLGNELLAALVVCLGGVLVSPISWTHHWVLAVLLVLLITDAVWRWPTARARPARAWYAWPAVLLPLVFLELPTPSGEFGALAPPGFVLLAPRPHAIPPQGVVPELHLTLAQRLVGEAYTIAGLIFLIMCAAVLSGTSIGRSRRLNQNEEPQ